MPLRYLTGEVIKKGDRVLMHGEPGEIEFVAETTTGHPHADWNLSVNGPGVMVSEPKHFGIVYIRDTENCEDLKFLSREDSTKS